MTFDSDYAVNARVVSADELAQIVDASRSGAKHRSASILKDVQIGASALLGLLAATIAAVSASAA